MSVAFRNCINGSVERGVISRDQGDQILERYDRETNAAGGDGMVGKAKAAEGLKAEAAERKRREILATKAAQRIAEDVRAYRGPDGKADIVSAITRLFENVGHTGYSSIRGRYNALLGAATSEIEDLLHASRRSFLTMRQRTDVNPADLVKAAFGETAPPAAKAFYSAWVGVAEKLRTRFNEAGGSIGWRDDWGLPTWHDGGAMLNSGFDRWQQFIEPRLKWDAMRHPLSDTPILPEEHADVLRHVYDSVTMDGWNTREPSRGGGGRPSLANSRSDPRFLQFQDADAWTAYNRQFGRGNVHDVMMGHINSMSKDVAAMQVLGPNPAASVGWLKQIIAQERARAQNGYPSLYKGRTNRFGDPAAIVDSMFEMSRGSGIPENAITQSFNFASNLQMAAKLGSAVLVHAAINPLVEANARAHYGLPVMSMIGDLSRSLSTADNREIARMGLTAQDAMHSLEQGARQRAALARMTEWSRWLPAITTHYSGLEAGVAALRRAWWWGTSGTITKLLETPFAEIPDRQRALLEGFGMNEGDWRVMQAADLYEPEQGASFLRWKEVADTGTAKPDQVLAAHGMSLGDQTPAPDGTTRFYHGGEPGPNSPAWLSPDQAYAQGYADKSNSRVHFVDVPNEHPSLVKSFDDEGADQTAPFVHFDADPDLAGRLQPLASISQNGPLAAQLAEATAMKYLEMLHQSMEFAVPSSRWRSRAALTLGTREGTAGNLLAKSFAMFKGFIGSATISHIEALRHELARNTSVGAAAAGANLIALTALGTMVLQLKTMSTGKDPLPLDPTTAEGRQTILHGMLTSGAMSVFGDFLASDQSSYGHGPLETLAGPVVTGGLDAYALTKGLGEKAFSTPKHPVAPGKAYSDTIAGGRQFLQNNTPLLSTHWALRAAYNRIVLDQLQYLLDPSAHAAWRKSEQRLYKETGQQYYWPPGEVAPTRPPQLSPGH